MHAHFQHLLELQHNLQPAFAGIFRNLTKTQIFIILPIDSDLIITQPIVGVLSLSELAVGGTAGWGLHRQG